MYTLGKSFTNIATSGKLTNQAGEATVLGILQPGLSESLGDLENDNLTDTLTIEADAQNLELSGATIVAMVGLLDEDDLSGIELSLIHILLDSIFLQEREAGLLGFFKRRGKDEKR